MTEPDKSEETGAEPTNDTDEVNAVVVHRVTQENGDIVCYVDTVGNVQMTEVDTILALGRKEFRQRLGLDA